MRMGFLIYEGLGKYEEDISHMWLCNCSILNFLMYEKNLIFYLISAVSPKQLEHLYSTMRHHSNYVWLAVADQYSSVAVSMVTKARCEQWPCHARKCKLSAGANWPIYIDRIFNPSNKKWEDKERDNVPVVPVIWYVLRCPVPEKLPGWLAGFDTGSLC